MYELCFIFDAVNIKPRILSNRATIMSSESPPLSPLTGDTTYINLADVSSTNVSIYINTAFRWEIPESIMNNIPPYLDPNTPIKLGVTDVYVSVTTQGMAEHVI